MTAKKSRENKVLQGLVVSDKMDKTRVVSIKRLVKHRLYGKIMRRSSRFYAHDEHNKSVVGDVVEISSAIPISKLKRWRITKIIAKSE